MSIWLNPNRITFDGTELSHVALVKIIRDAGKLVDGDEFTQTVEPNNVHTEIIVHQVLLDAISGTPFIADEGELMFETSLGRSSGHHVRLSMDALLIKRMSKLNRDGQSVEEYRFLAIPGSVGEDPITYTGLLP